MKLQVENGCEDELGCLEWVNFFAQAEEVCSVRVTNRRKDKFFGRSLRRVAIVRLDDAAELLLAANSSGELGSEGFVQDLVVHADTSMGAKGVVMSDPRPNDVIQLLLTEAHEVIEAFVLERTNERFDKCVCLGRSDRCPHWPRALLVPEVAETVRELPIAITKQESRLDALVLHPHRRVARLLHDPVPMGRVGRRAGVDLASAEMDEDQNVGMEHASKGVDLLREKVARDDGINIRMHEGRPLHRRVFDRLVRPRAESAVGENLPGCGRSDTAPELLELSDDTAVSPEDVLPREPNHQLTCGLGDSRPTRAPERNFIPRLPKPSTVGLRLDDLHDVSDVVIHHRTQSQEFRLLFGRRHDSAGIDPISQHSYLGLENAELGVVPWPEVLGDEHQNRENETIHTQSFKMGENSKRPDIEGYTTGPIFSNPLDRGGIPARRPVCGFGASARRNPILFAEPEFPVNSLLIWKGNQGCVA